jgi:hypothetical protein
VHATLKDLAKAKGIGKTHASQVLPLTLLAPELVEAILDERPPRGCSSMICWTDSRWIGRGRRSIGRDRPA